MDFANYYYDYIGATGTHTINDYIDYTSNNNFIYTSNSSNSNINYSSNSSNNIINYYKRLIDYKLESGINNTYIYNCNVGGEIKFFIPVPYYDPFENASGQPYRVKINPLGKLYLYYNYDALISLTDTEGWYDIINLVMGTRASINTQGIAITAIQGQIAVLFSQQNANNNLFGNRIDDLSRQIFNNYEDTNWSLLTNTYPTISGSFTNMVERFFYNNILQSPLIVGGLGLTGIGGIIGGAVYNLHYSQQIGNILEQYTKYHIDSNTNLDINQKNNLRSLTSNLYVSNIINYNCNLCNLCLFNGFINSNSITTQFINELKSNKILLGNITTPNSAYQMEMTGDLNLNMIYLNSTSLTSLLNQKQGNLTFNNPLLNTTNIITLKKDASLTIDGSGNLSVVKTSSLPLVITGNNWTLNYDSTLTLSGNNLSVSSATASKWTQSGNIIYNNNIGNVGIGTTNPLYKLHIEDGSLFVGDVSYTSAGLGTANGYKLIFDNTYNGTAGTGNICNKIILHNHTNFNAGFGLESDALVYQSGNRHRFYNGTTSSVYGFLGAEFYRDNFRFYGSTNSGSGGVISNGNAGSSAYSYVSLANDIGNGILFLNSSTKTTDGGANCLTLRNDVSGGDLRLSANLDTPYIFLKKSTGLIGIDTTAPAYKLHVNGSLGCGAINSLSITTNNNAINAGTGGLTCAAINCGSITTNNNSINAGTATITATNFSGKITPMVNVWNTSSDGYNRFYFANTSRTYFSSGSGFEWRHSTDAGIAVMSTIGQLGLDNLSPIGLLSLGDSSKVGSDGTLVIHKNSGGGSQRHMKMGFYTSTYDLTIGDFGNNNLPGSWVKTFYITWNAPNTSLGVLSNGIVYSYYGFQSASDIKLKTDIKTIENSLWKVEQLRGVEYNHIITQDKNIGLIAQEVEHIVPEVIGYNEETNTKTINYNGLVGLLVEAIKELKTEINNLNNRIELLEKERENAYNI